MPKDKKTDASDVACPIACGECCSYWRDVDELTVKYPDCKVWQPCPHLEENEGCTLPRNERPHICKEYLCGKASAVVDPNSHTAQMMREILARVQS